MEFLNSMFGPEDDPMKHASTLRAAWDEGDKAAAEFVNKLRGMAKKYLDKDMPMEGSILIFVAVLRAMGAIKQTVSSNHLQKNGVVRQTWDMLERVLTGDNPDQAIAQMLKDMGRED